MPNLRSLPTCDIGLELRPLPSPGITRLQRYYGPLRHPRAPGLTLTGCQLTHALDHALGLPVLRLSSSFMHAVATTPAEPSGCASLASPQDSGLPRILGGSASASSFSRPAQRSLALRPACSPSPLQDPLHRRLQPLRYLHVCSGCFRLERKLPDGVRTR